MRHAGGGLSPGSGSGRWEGHGPDFHKAAEKAADKAKAANGPGKYKVIEIEVEIVNPISDYKVVLGD